VIALLTREGDEVGRYRCGADALRALDAERHPESGRWVPDDGQEGRPFDQISGRIELRWGEGKPYSWVVAPIDGEAMFRFRLEHPAHEPVEEEIHCASGIADDVRRYAGRQARVLMERSLRGRWRVAWVRWVGPVTQAMSAEEAFARCAD
jgi:hypothetical protein